MGRWEPDAKGRLRRAALELYAERGFDQTTAADVAERAGVTERTYFRYFSDKREALFEGTQALQDAVLASIAEASADLGPMEVMGRAMEETGVVLTDRAFSRLRADVIAKNPELLERELLKLARLAAASAEALTARGVPPLTAGLAAESGVTVFRVGFENWIGDGAESLADCIRGALVELAALTSTPR